MPFFFIKGIRLLRLSEMVHMEKDSIIGLNYVWKSLAENTKPETLNTNDLYIIKQNFNISI